MDIMGNLQNLMRGAGGHGNVGHRSTGGGLGGLLTPEMLGGLATALLAGKAGGRSMGASTGLSGMGGLGGLGGLLGSLMNGGGTATGGSGGGLGGLFGSLIGGDAAPAAASPAATRPQAQPAPEDKAMRMIRTLVFAAKADGHVDANEEGSIRAQMAKLGLGREGQSMVDRAMAEPLDPALVARGVVDMNEAAGLYAVSCAITDMDHFMERSYLDGLATALSISPEDKARIEATVRG